ncbi:MAG: HAMP domain-containing histidine kinase [Tannerella sp.]|jgi:signal transduction histidine kinase|nr:HAMP domain-containing histidine kinase [Tannerella sp.]
MNSLYDKRQYLKYLFLIAAMLIAVGSVVVSNSMVNKLATEERLKMEVWTEAYRFFLMEDTIADPTMLVLKVIGGNTTIPILLYDEGSGLVEPRNIDVPEKSQDAFFRRKMQEFGTRHEPFVIEVGKKQYLYYDDSILLKRLEMYPYVQLLVVAVFVMIAFFALASTKRAEQNKVWVGLSKETAHQLGTPISSLIAWIEYLKTKEIDASYLTEMEKDVKRLEMIVDRFSKIGSNPEPLPLNINQAIRSACEYMEARISSKVKMKLELADRPIFTLMNESLFSWVIENLTKNAVDAMNGQGSIAYQVSEKGNKVRLDITDTGKGIPKSKFGAIFNPGYTTKARGWGLGLSLVKRIVESYPGGRIFVKNSEPGKGTTFRIEMRKYRKAL